MNPETIISKSNKIVARKSGDEYILVPIKDNIADMKAVYTMNNTAAFIWDRIDGIKTLNELAADVSEEFDIDKTTALKDVGELIDDLKQHLIVTG